MAKKHMIQQTSPSTVHGHSGGLAGNNPPKPGTMTTVTTFNITNPTTNDWTDIQHLIEEYKLDDNDLSIDQFIVCKVEQKLLAFGRIKKHSDFDELSSLGVLTTYRNKGIGKIMVHELIKLITKNIFIVTVIPDYFTKLGFEKISQYPESMIAKQNDCKDTCVCGSPTVMTFKK